MNSKMQSIFISLILILMPDINGKISIKIKIYILNLICLCSILERIKMMEIINKKKLNDVQLFVRSFS